MCYHQKKCSCSDCLGLLVVQEVFLDPWPWPEGSCEIGSVRPSFRLSVSFLGIGSLVFPETQRGVRGPYRVVYDSQIFGKNRHQAKITKNGKNGSKTGFWDFLRKSCHQFSLELVQNEDSYGSLTFCQNCMAGKNPVLKLQPKMRLGQ